MTVEAMGIYPVIILIGCLLKQSFDWLSGTLRVSRKESPRIVVTVLGAASQVIYSQEIST